MVTADQLYKIPLLLEASGIGDYLLERLDLEPRKIPDWREWEKIVEADSRQKPKVKIAIVGKYVELHDAYMSVREALCHAGPINGVEVEVLWVHSTELEKPSGLDLIQSADGIIVPGGFGERGVEGKIEAAKYARENKIPYFGLCLGLQVMVVEFARNVLGYKNANSTEFDPSTPYPIIDLMPDQRILSDMGGTMRLGLYPCHLKPNSKAALAYQSDTVEERHRHRFEFVNSYRGIMMENGVVFSGLSPDERLVEITELSDHPFMLGTQFHPEFLSRPNRPHPLFEAFVAAVKKQAGIK